MKYLALLIAACQLAVSMWLIPLAREMHAGTAVTNLVAFGVASLVAIVLLTKP